MHVKAFFEAIAFLKAKNQRDRQNPKAYNLGV